MFFNHMPNIISLSRCLIGGSLLASNFLWPLSGDGYVFWFFLAFVSDALDGWVARLLRVTSVTGAWLDLFADKVLFLSVWVFIGLRYACSWVVYVSIMLLGLRELCVLVVRSFAFRRGLVLTAQNHGKYKTFYLGVLAMLTIAYAEHVSPIFPPIFDGLWIMGIVASWYSLGRYTILCLRHRGKSAA